MPKISINSKKKLGLIYTPGVASVSEAIAKDISLAKKYTLKSNCVAIVTDGSAVLGLGNIGPEAAIPVMEGKAVLFKKFAGINAFPICLKNQESDDIIRTVVNISPIFSGINLEDISAPRCFEIEKKLTEILDIPVFHDDQHGTAIVVLAALINSLRVVKKKIAQIKIVVNGAGAAGIAITKLLALAGVKNIILIDSVGIISRKRKDLPSHKQNLLKILSTEPSVGRLEEALIKADVFIGVSQGGILKPNYLKNMNRDPIIFALANPIPEIMPDLALKNGAKIMATGRSDFPNQINNALVFPGFFRGLLDAKIQKVTDKMKIDAAKALAGLVKTPNTKKIIPSIFDKRIVPTLKKIF